MEAYFYFCQHFIPRLAHLSGKYFPSLPRLAPVWDDIFTPTISSPRGENIVTIFSPPLRYFHPLTISNGKSFCTQISLNIIMCIYDKAPFLYFLWLFTDFCPSQTVDTIHWHIHQNTKFQQQRGYHGVNIWIWMIKPWYHCRVKFG